MMANARRRLTGRHVLIWALAFFGIVTLVNAVMIWFALTTNEAVLKRTSTIRSVPDPVVAIRIPEKERTRWRI